MNLFCRLFGHTWTQVTRAPETRWNTTKDGHILVATTDDRDIEHLDVCRRCGAERPAGRRRHDRDHERAADGSTGDAAGAAGS